MKKCAAKLQNLPLKTKNLSKNNEKAQIPVWRSARQGKSYVNYCEMPIILFIFFHIYLLFCKIYVNLHSDYNNPALNCFR